MYELPYLAHAPMEPLNCLADVRPDGCDIWTGTQFQTAAHQAAVEITGLKPDQVKLHTTLLGGGFGRRGVFDSHFVREAVQVSKLVQAPVKVIWTREDDIRGGYYRPAALHSIEAGLDAVGNPMAWRQDIVCQSFMVNTPFEGSMIKDGVDQAAVEGAANLAYKIPNLLVNWHQAPDGVPTLWWRSVGHSHTAFVVESFLDELAHAGKKTRIPIAGLCLQNSRATCGSWNSRLKKPVGADRCPPAGAGAWPCMPPSAAMSPRWRKSQSLRKG